METKLHLIAHVSVSKRKINSSISSLSLTLNTSVLFTRFLYRLRDSPSCSLEVKSRLVNYLFGCSLFLIF